MDRMKRTRLVNLRAVKPDEWGHSPSTRQEIKGVVLGFRLVLSDQAEVWTVRGIFSDGNVTEDDIGVLSFVMIPGDLPPATTVTGFIAPPPAYEMALREETLTQQLRSMLVQLGYDHDGFYVSIGIGGRHLYYEDYDRVGR